MDGTPLAYLLTFRAYGTWLPGDDRGSTDRRRNIYGTPLESPSQARERLAQDRLGHGPIALDRAMRGAIREAIGEVSVHRQWHIHALNVRTNHVHVVVSAPGIAPELVMTAFKTWSTRAMRRRGVVGRDIRPWSRHGSTRWVWTERELIAACEYVLEGQGEPLDDAGAG